jgi:hypothetical protein
MRAWAAAGTLAFASLSCSGNPSSPTPSPSNATVTNTPPVVQSVTASASRVEADQELQLTAVVQDAETAVSDLTYAWSATPLPGTFSGTGASVRWRAPTGATTPDLYTLTLTVTERYTSGGVQKTNQASGSVQVHYNDSSAEIRNLVSQFLTDFGTFSVTPEQCVRNFSDSCPGKAEELSNIRDNRREVHIESATFNPSAFAITVNSAGTKANIDAPCTFKDNLGTTSGDCLLTAVYESFKWLLCDSHYTGVATPNARDIRRGDVLQGYRYRVP